MVHNETNDHLIPAQLTPSFHGMECLGNGEWPGYECQCDECEHYLTCFPDWKLQEMTTEELQAVARADYAGEPVKEDYLFAVLDELARRTKAANPLRKNVQEAWNEFLMYYAEEQWDNEQR